MEKTAPSSPSWIYLWLLTGWQLPTFASQFLTYVGNLVTPLVLIYIGIVLADSGLSYIRIDRDSLLALIGRFIIAPAIMILLIKVIVPATSWSVPDLLGRTFIVQSGTPALAVLPVSLDVGTNNQELIDDPFYLGNKHERVAGKKYYDFVDKFVKAAREAFPGVYLHFEDFGRDNATKILKEYRQDLPIFNDDVQGTGIVCLSGVLGALNISGEKFTDQIFLTFGAGTAGMGIANMLYREMLVEGMDPQEAKKHFYLVDKQGLLFSDTPDLTPEQKSFVRERSEFKNSEELTNLEAVVKAVHPTVMIGTSTKPGAFTEAVVKEMAAHTARPIIFPISNPTKLIEAHAEDLIKWTDGRALVATGIPSDPVEYKGVTYHIGQANNALIYPGLGLGVLASQAKLVPDELLSAAAHSLGGIVDPKKPGAAVLPPVAKLQSFTAKEAVAVVQTAIDLGIASRDVLDAKKATEAMKWEARY